MTRLSTDITSKVRSCLFVLSALEQQGPTVADLVQQQIEASLSEGDEPPRFLAQITALGRHLEAAQNQMVELDGRLFDQRAKKAARLAERDARRKALGRRISGLRQIFIGHYAAPGLDQLGFSGRVSREPIALLRQSELILEQLRAEDAAEALGESLFDPPLDLAAYAQQLDSHIRDLRIAFEAHQNARRQIDKVLADKKQAVKTYEVVFLRVARQFEDLCRLAGLNELANKVRPSRRRPGQTVMATTTNVEESATPREAPATSSDLPNNPTPRQTAISNRPPDHDPPERGEPVTQTDGPRDQISLLRL